MALAPHPRRGWWLIVRSIRQADRWHILRLTSAGVAARNAVSLSPSIAPHDDFSTHLRFSPDNRRLAVVGVDSAPVCVYDFDAATGDLALAYAGTVPGRDTVERWPRRHIFDAAWSASGRFLYVSDELSLHQLDTWAQPLDSGWTRIDPPAREGRYNAYSRLQRGPDCRIYVGGFGGGTYLTVVDEPERPGLACAVKNRGIPTRYYFVGIPQHPNYHQWARYRVARGLAPLVDTAVCDASILPYDYQADPVSAVGPEAPPGYGAGGGGADGLALRVWPNPAAAGGSVTVGWRIEATSPTRSIEVTLRDGQGRIVRDQALSVSQAEGGLRTISLSLDGLLPGVYTAQLTASGRRLGSTRLVVVRR